MESAKAIEPPMPSEVIAKSQREVVETTTVNKQIGSFNALCKADQDKILSESMSKEAKQVVKFLKDTKRTSMELPVANHQSLTLKKREVLPVGILGDNCCYLDVINGQDKSIVLALKKTGTFLPYFSFNLGRDLHPPFYIGISDDERIKRQLQCSEHMKIIQVETKAFHEANMDDITAKKLGKMLPDYEGYWDTNFAPDIECAEAHVLYGWKQGVGTVMAMVNLFQALYAVITQDMMFLYEISPLNDCCLGSAKLIPHVPLTLEKVPVFRWGKTPDNPALPVIHAAGRFSAMHRGLKFCPHLFTMIPRPEIIAHGPQTLRQDLLLMTLAKAAPNFELDIVDKVIGRDYTVYFCTMRTQQDVKCLFMMVGFRRLESCFESIFQMHGIVASNIVFSNGLPALVQLLNSSMTYTGGMTSTVVPIFYKSMVDVHSVVSQHVEEAVHVPTDQLPEKCENLDQRLALLKENWNQHLEATSSLKIMLPDGHIYRENELKESVPQELTVETFCIDDCIVD